MLKLESVNAFFEFLESFYYGYLFRSIVNSSDAIPPETKYVSKTKNKSLIQDIWQLNVGLTHNFSRTQEYTQTSIISSAKSYELQKTSAEIHAPNNAKIHLSFNIKNRKIRSNRPVTLCFYIKMVLADSANLEAIFYDLNQNSKYNIQRKEFWEQAQGIELRLEKFKETQLYL